MKILIFLKKWPGGVGVVTRNLESELKRLGCSVKSISREDDLKSYSSIRNLFWLRKKMKKIILQENPDIIYTQDWSMALPLMIFSRLFRKKHFSCFHGIQPGISNFLQRIIGRLLKSKLIVVGDGLKKVFPKSNLIYNGVNLELFKPDKEIKKIKNSVGFANWKNDDYNYNKIKESCKRLKKRLIVAENIPYNKMPEFYQKLECFISLPPKCAGFNMSWIEAMACSVPKIVGSVSGIGSKLNIDKVADGESVMQTINKAVERDYRSYVKTLNVDIKKNAKKILEVFMK